MKDMEATLIIIAYVLTILLLLFVFSSYLLQKRQRNPSTTTTLLRLPPGSMGWPYIGDTLQLYSQNPNLFFAAKQKRYGEIFKTHILGCPCVMLANPEAAKFVLNQSHLFKPTYPDSKERLIGVSAIFFHQGDYHTFLRKLVQSSLSLQVIQNLVPDIEAIASSAFSKSHGGHVINTFQEMKKISFEVGILAIFGHLEVPYKEDLRKNYSMVEKGYNCFPTNFPASPYRKALLARKRLSKILSEIISERKENKLVEKDLLASLLNSKDEKGEILTQDQIADNIIGVLFAAQDTTATAMTWIIKYLHETPKLLHSVKAEHKAIWRLNSEGNKPLSWSQTRDMSLTQKVVLESLRMASIISFTFRETVADVEYNGYLIPKGWKVMPLFRNIHQNPQFFSQPQKFDPSRFEVAPRPNTFMPFGSGVHSCPGNELAKLEMLVVIHHLLTNFRWEAVESENGIQYDPFPVPLHGLPARLWKESNSSNALP